MAKLSGSIVDTNFILFNLHALSGFSDRPLRLLLDTTKIIGIQDTFITEEFGGTRKCALIYTQAATFIVRETVEQVITGLNLSSLIITI